MNLHIELNSTFRFSMEEKKINFNWKRKINKKGCIIGGKEEKILIYNFGPMKQCISKIDTTSILWDEIIEQQFITRWEMPCMKRRNKNESVARHGTYQLTVVAHYKIGL